MEKTSVAETTSRSLGLLQALRQLQSLGLSQPLKLDYFENWSPEAIERIDWDELQTMIALWCQHIEVAVKVLYTSERKLVRQVLGHLSDQDTWEICFLKVASPGMIQFLQFGEGVACSQRAPEKLCKLLDMFEAFEKCVTTIDTVFEYKGPGFELRTRTEELQKLVSKQQQYLSLLNWKCHSEISVVVQTCKGLCRFKI